MKFNNYLSKLTGGENSKIKEEICLYGCSDIIKEIYTEIKASSSGNSISLIKEKLSIPYQTLYCWVCGSNPIPISKSFALLKLWKEVCNKDEYDFINQVEDLYNSVTYYSQNGQRRVKLPKQLDEELGYLIGYFQGDGHLASTVIRGFRQYSLHFYDSNRDMILKINELLQEEFSTKGIIYISSDKKGSWFTLRITSKPIYLFFERILGLKVGRKTLNVDTPQIIKNSEENIQLAFIRGFFDAEGAVGETKKNPWLDIGQASKGFPSEILFWINHTLANKGILLSEPQKVSNQEFFRLRTGKRDTIKRFFNLVSSFHPSKINRFEEIIKKC